METLVKNSSTVASIYEAFGKGDISFILSQLDKNVSWRPMGSKPNPISGIYNGASEVPKFFTALAENFQIDNFSVHYVLDLDDNNVLARGSHSGKALKTGKPLESDWAMEWKFNDDGKVIEYKSIYDTQAFVEAL
jgi:ketosteroid isomerase-like protein